MILLDTNLPIRYLAEDNEKQALAVERVFRNSKIKLYLSDLVVAETVWVLKSVYEVPKSQIVGKLQTLLSIKTISFNKRVISRALANYKNHNISWIDAYLAALAQSGKYKAIYSFDKHFDRMKDVRRLEPR